MKHYLQEAADLGCGMWDGYMEWQDIDKFLNKAIRSVGKGEGWVSRRLVGLLIRKLRG